METKICGAPHPDEKMIRCAIHAGHGRVRDKEDPSSEWYEHASPAHGAWWNVEPVPDVAVPRPILPPDISIPRQDGQPFGDRYLTYHHEGDLVGVVVPSREGVVDLAKVSVDLDRVLDPTVIETGVKVIGPECFVSLDENVLNWRGRNYVPQDEFTGATSLDDVETEVETWYGVFNDPATLLPKFESGEIHAGLRETLLDTPIFESRNLGDVLRHAQLTWEDRQVQHRDKVRVAEAQLLAPTRVVDGKLVRITPEVPPPTPIVIKTQTTTRTGWAIVPPDVLKNAAGGPAIREVSM